MRFNEDAGEKMVAEDVRRLEPTPSTIKKLFAYSGNQCAIPACKEQLVDETGAMLGKVAHIHAAEKGGARFDRNMTNEQRRMFENLMLVCGKHHDIIDYKDNEAAYDAPTLRKFKKDHEDRFRRAERQLLDEVSDSTQATQPTYPKNLLGLAAALNYGDLLDVDEELEGVAAFIDKLKELPLAQRDFAIKVAERMKRNDKERLLVEDVMGSFNLGLTKLKEHLKVLEAHGLGGHAEGSEYNQFYVELWDRRPGGNPWIEMLDFCEKTGTPISEFVYDLDFSPYEGDA